MDPYIDQADFEQYTDTVISAEEFSVLAKRASDIIDMLTDQRIRIAGGLETYPTATQEMVKRATAAQVETLYYQGGIDAVTGNAGLSAAAIGKFSYQGSTGSATQTLNGMPISPLASGYLLMTGLLYRGVSVLG